MFLRSDLLPAARVMPTRGGRTRSSTRCTPALSRTRTATGSEISTVSTVASSTWRASGRHHLDLPHLSLAAGRQRYDISDYRDIDPLFGDLAAFDALIARAHELGMRVVMDLVVNHTSIKHPWFVESASGRESARRDWYYWRDPRPGLEPGTPGAEPTNWESFFGGSAGSTIQPRASTTFTCSPASSRI